MENLSSFSENKPPPLKWRLTRKGGLVVTYATTSRNRLISAVLNRADRRYVDIHFR